MQAPLTSLVNPATLTDRSPCGSTTKTEASKGNSRDVPAVHHGDITMKTKYQVRLPVRLGPVWDFSLWFARNLVRLPRRIPSLSLKADTMKTTNLKQTSVAKPRKWFQWRCRWHAPREARAERSQFRDQRSRLHLREFAKNSRIFAALAPGANRAPQFFFPRKSGSQNSTGIRCADTPSTKGDP